MATRTKGRVVLSKNPEENLRVSKTVYEKHLDLGAASPLLILQDVDWNVIGPKIAPTLLEHDQAEFHKGESEKHYAERDKEMPGIVNGLKLSINFLKSSYGLNPKKLIEWGINIDDTPKAKPKPNA